MGGLLKDADGGGTPSVTDAADAPRMLPLSEDELAGLAWLEHVTGPLPDEEEREWWDIGGTQHGIFAKRYNIAFVGYAAAAIGMRGDAEVKTRVGKVLGNCIERILRTDVWAYSMSKNYWGRKPWAPDPCYRENVMYTGHLLHLLDGCGDGTGGVGCCDPRPVSPSVASVFLAAAARACSDPETAERLESAVDSKYLKREGGLLWLDVNREWRIGATAMRIISLAESRGSRFRRRKDQSLSTQH